MSDDPVLDLDEAAGAGPTADGVVVCGRCAAAIEGAYWALDGEPTCEPCTGQERRRQSGEGSRLGRFFRASLGGFAGALLGSLIYFAILKLTGYEVGLIAILVGFLVGGGVRWGASGRGGWLYQMMAVGLTYLAIVATYVPIILDQMSYEEFIAMEPSDDEGAEDGSAEEPSADPPSADPPSADPPSADPPSADPPSADEPVAPDPADDPAAGDAPVAAEPEQVAAEEEVPEEVMKVVFYLVVLLGALVGPFLAGLENIIGLLIIGFALWQAWKMNRRPTAAITGPFQTQAGQLAVPIEWTGNDPGPTP